MRFLRRNAKRLAIECLGWLLIAGGIAALILPGPGLLMLFAGMYLLASQHAWAERRLEPIRRAAISTATSSVKTGLRIASSVVFSLVLIAAGVLWGLQPAAPQWWPLSDTWWLIGGWGIGGTLIGSGLIALIMIIYSYQNFRPRH